MNRFAIGLKSVLVVIVVCFLGLQSDAQGIKWTTDGQGYYRTEGGEIVQYALPANTKKVLLSKTELTPSGQTKNLNVRSFSFSVDGTKTLIYTNTKKVWRLDTRGDYWVFDRKDNSLKQLGKKTGFLINVCKVFSRWQQKWLM